MANKQLKDRGSRKHLLDLFESNYRKTINTLIARSGYRLADSPHLHPCGRTNTDAWTEFEIEEYLSEPTRQFAGLPTVAEDWWLAHKTRNSSRPTWDLIGHLTGANSKPGILLVEAKANVAELDAKKGMSKSTGSEESDANADRIRKRVLNTQGILNRLNHSRIKLPFDHHFQLVNRLAYGCHLASLGYHVVLLYLGFCGDTYFRDPILDQSHWDRVMGGYLEGIVSQAFPERLHEFKGGGSLQMLIDSLPVKSVSE